MQHRTTGALFGATLLLTLAACGSGSDGAAPIATDGQPAATPAPAPADEDLASADSTETDSTETDSTEADSTQAESAPAESNELESAEPAGSTGPETDGTDTVAPEPAATVEAAPEEPAATDAPEADTSAEPVVGGRLFAADVQPAAQFDANPFPDLVVEDIGKDAQVNVKNILPSDRPVLLWAWAPH